MRRIALIALVLIAGCGGGDEEKPLTAETWAARADAACKRASDAIAERGWARDLHELPVRAAGAGDDVHAAVAEIRRLPIPADGANRIRPFVAALDGLEPVIEDVIWASAATDLVDLQVTAIRLRGRLSTLESTAAGAGLRSCLQNDELSHAVDGIRAPLAAEQIARVNIRLGERMESIARRRGDDTKKVGPMVPALRDATNGVADVDPPSWVVLEVSRYADELGDYEALAHEVHARGLTKSGRAAISAAARRVHRACVRAMSAIGADPISPPPASD